MDFSRPIGDHGFANLADAALRDKVKEEVHDIDISPSDVDKEGRAGGTPEGLMPRTPEG